MSNLNKQRFIESVLSKDSFIQINVKILYLLGLNVAIYLPILIWKNKVFRNRTDSDGYFFCTQDDLELETLLTPYKQAECNKILKSCGILEIKKIGLPAKNYFKINYDKIDELLTSSDDKIKELVIKNFDHCHSKNLITDVNIDVDDSFSSKKDYIHTSYNPSFSSEKEKRISDEILSPLPTRIRKKIQIKTHKILPSELHPQLTPKKQEPPLQVTSTVKEVLDFWLEQNLHLPKQNTKSYDNCIRKVKGLLNGRLFSQKYSIEEIKTSIMNFSFAALDPDFEPTDLSYKKILSKKNIDEFIYNSYNSNGNSSLFKNYLKDPPKAIKSKQVVTTDYPVVANKLRGFYVEGVLGGIKVELSVRDENCFRIAANKIMEFYKNNHSQFSSYMNINPPLMAQWLWESIKVDCNDDVSKITPGWFVSDTTFNRRYPAYLFRQAILEEKGTKTFNMYDYDKQTLSEKEKREQALERGDIILDV